MKKADREAMKKGVKPPAPLQDRVFEWEGRRFVLSSKVSFRQDTRALDLAEQAGLNAFFTQVAAKPNQPIDANEARQLMLQAYRKGVLFHLLAALLREEGKEKWTEEDANEIAAWLPDITDPTAKSEVWDGVLGILLGFFNAARAVSQNSQPSAATPAKSPSTTTPFTTAPTAAPGGAEPGPASFENSPSTSPAGTSLSLTGT